MSGRNNYILHNYCYPDCSTDQQDNCIINTKKFFFEKIQNYIQDEEDQICLLAGLVRSSLVWMRMMKVEVESHINLSQWFLWLQEKSLFGFASLLANDTPGLSFHAADLVKNLLLSAFLEKTVQYQDEVYQRLWRINIQENIPDIDDFLGWFFL